MAAFVGDDCRSVTRRNEIARRDDQGRMTAPDFKPIADSGLLSDCNGSAVTQIRP